MSQPHHHVTIALPRFAVWILAGVLLAPWLAFAGWVITQRAAPQKNQATAQPKPTIVSGNDALRAKPGPWGNLELHRILIEPPEEFVLTDYTQASISPWLFKGYSEAELANLWDAAGLTAEQRADLNRPERRKVNRDGITITPTRDLILGLSATARARIYTALGEFPENPPQHNPYRLRRTFATDWLDRVELPTDAIALTKRLLYERGAAVCFSDEALVLPTIQEPSDRVKFIKALSRKSALLVHLKVEHGAEVSKLVEYWGRGGRSKDLTPLLQSLARRPEGGWIDIVHLVPRFARLLAYTYPLPSEKPIDANHDCHWTSFNFQNEQPDERLSDINFVKRVLVENYYPVLGPATLGDIIMFVRSEDGVVVHSCVYIADDIVFTKNGPAFSMPWLFASLADVQAFYAANPGIEMRRFRAKGQ